MKSTMKTTLTLLIFFTLLFSLVPVTASRDESLLKIFWTDTHTDKIQRANLNGSNIEDLVTQGLRDPGDIVLDAEDGKIYWTDDSTRKIQRANLDGSNIEDLVTQGLRYPCGIALDVEGDKMYWTDAHTDKIQRANLDGSNIEDLVTQGLRYPCGIALDVENGKMYWTDMSTDKIQRTNLDGSNIEDLVTRTQGLRYPSDIVLDVEGGKMYWTDAHTDKIQRANLNGSDVEDLVTQGLEYPVGIVLDVEGGKMYWTDAHTDKIQRANLNGSDVEDLVTQGLRFPNGIAIGILSPVNPVIVKEDVDRDNVVDVHDNEPTRPTVNLSKSPPIVAPGKDFTLNATVENIGGISDPATLQFYGPVKVAHTLVLVQLKSGVMPAIDFMDKTLDEAIPIAEIDVDGTHKQTKTVTAPDTAGTYAYKVCIEGVDGAEETDSTCSDVITIRVAPPDLQFGKVWAEPAIVAPGKEFKLYATVRNLGSRSDKTVLWWHYEGTTGDTDHHEELQGTRIDPLPTADGKATVTKHITVTAPEIPGTYYYGPSIDKVEGEEDTDNNYANNVTVTVGGSDLVIKDIWATRDGDRINHVEINYRAFNLHVLIKNEGNAKSEKTTLRYFRSINQNVSKSDRELYQIDDKNEFDADHKSHSVPALEPGDEVELFLEETMAPQTVSNHYYRAEVANVLSESDGNNWSDVLTVPVAPGSDGLEIPERFISQVAYSKDNTYFVLSPKFAKLTGKKDPNSYIPHICTITLRIGDIPNYFMFPLDPPPSVGEQLEEVGRQIGEMLTLSIAGKVKLGTVVPQFLIKNLGKELKVIRILSEILDISDPNNHPIVSMTYYPNSDFNQGKTIEGDVPILFVIQNQRLSSISFEVEQQYYEKGNWFPTNVDFTVPVIETEDSDNWLSKALSVVSNVIIGIENVVWKKLSEVVNTINNELFVGDPGMSVKYTGEWNLEETWQLENGTLAAPRAQLMSLADYPPFQQLSPEMQEYLLRYLGESANPGTINPEAWQVPEETSLLPNYPNPFNPETWIPYQLATPADVTLTIYDINGHVVRDLDLGHQRAGVYHGRSRAAHWDGRNAQGEPVASGLYFYTLKAGDWTATRKMLIRK